MSDGGCCVVKITTQQLKTVVLWVFWTLAFVGHRMFVYDDADLEVSDTCVRNSVELS